MKNDQCQSRLKLRTFLIMAMLICFTAPVILAQLPARIEKSIDDYYNEVVKVYKIIETEEVDVALQKIDDLKPSIEQKAKHLANLANEDPELLEILDSEDFLEEFQDKPYFKELMRIMQSEAFNKKFSANTKLQSKVEEIENLIESYTNTAEESQEERSDRASGIAFTIIINGSHKYSGTYTIMADFEEGAVAYIDDLEYLRIDIIGEANGKEAVVSFFVDNTGPGRQEWATDGHFAFELMDTDGELAISLWGSEEMGYFDITRVDGPGGFVTGRIIGKCIDPNGDSDVPIPVTADFKVKYIKNTY
jgi:hypothetical protein